MEILKHILQLLRNCFVPVKEEIGTSYRYFTLEEYLKGHASPIDLNMELKENIHNLLLKVDLLRDSYGKPLTISSGYRPTEYNRSVGGAINSAHISGQAVDFYDNTGELKQWIKDNITILEELDLYMESGEFTPTWVHLQTRPTKNRVFKIR